MAQREFDEKLDQLKREKRIEEEKVAVEQEHVIELKRLFELEKLQMEEIFKQEVTAKFEEIEALKVARTDAKNYIDELKKELEASDQELSTLKSKTDDIITSLEERNKLLTDEFSKAKKSKVVQRDLEIVTTPAPEREDYTTKFREYEKSVKQLQDTIAMLQADRGQLLKDYAVRDKELVDLRAKLSQYDSGIDGMVEARREITYLKEQISEREKIIAELKLELNKYLNNLANLSDMVALFERKYNIKISKDEVAQIAKNERT